MQLSPIIEYNYVTGYLVDVVDNISKTIRELKALNAKVKVGITARDPQEFFDEQLQIKDWDKMTIIYDTKSKKFADDIKNHLVHINWQNNDNEVDNTGLYTLYALIIE